MFTTNTDSQNRRRRKLICSLAAALTFTVAGTLLAQPDDLELELVTSGLTRPVAIRHAGDGSGRLFIVEQPGRIRIWNGVDVLAQSFLDIQGLVDSSGNEQGLLGLAFHPNYETNGLFFVNYTRDPGAGLDRTVVARYSVSAGDPNQADPNSAVTIIEIEQDFGNHNGGDIHFGPDGFLYIGMGDGGSGGDPNGRAQSPLSLLGKILRLDIDAVPVRGGAEVCGLGGSYGIPAGNPYSGVDGFCNEIWTWGWRNPWRFSFDRLTGDMIIGDVGQNAMEEISFNAAGDGGDNYGWDCKEGTLAFDPCDPMPTVIDPILSYLQSDNQPTSMDPRGSVTGGFRYRGAAIPALQGLYVYADYVSGRFWIATETSPGVWSETEFFDLVVSSPSTFGEDESGELYVANLPSGNIYRFSSPSSIFADGFESGNTSAW